MGCEETENTHVRWRESFNRTNKNKKEEGFESEIETERRMHGVRWVSGLARESEANLKHTVCEGVHVGFAGSRKLPLERIDSKVVSFNRHVWRSYIYQWAFQ